MARDIISIRSVVRPDFDFIKKDIFRGESGGDYDALFNYQNRPGGLFDDIKVSEMTVDQALNFASPQSGYGNYVKMANPENVYATPMGAYQVVGNTLKMAKKGLGLSGDETMTPALQDRIGKYIYDVQGTDAWAGYQGPRHGPKPKGYEGAYMMDPDPQNSQKTQPGIMGLIQAGGRAVKEGLQNPDLMNRLALGFNTMRLEPDANLAAAIRESMARRSDMAATSGAANRSVDVLRNMKGPDGQPIPEAIEAADAIEANPQMAMQILNSFYQMRASGRLAQQTSRYQLPDGVVTITTLKNNKTVVKLNGQEVTDPAKISELVGQAQEFEIEQEARIAGGKTTAQKEAENLVTARKSYRAAVELEGTSVDVISRILNNPQGLIDGTGALVGGVRPDDTRFRALSAEAQDFITNHYQLMGTVFTSVFEALKGGGSITENETTQAKAAAARMNTATTPAVYIEALREYRQRLANAIAARKDEIDGVDPTRTDTELNFEIFPEEL
jgi:hypothetical protein